jgi:hypothetical protein
MHNFVKLAGSASLALALAACGGQSSVPPAQQALTQSHQAQSTGKLADGVQFGRVKMALRGHQAMHPNLSGLLNYGGGQIQSVPKIYVLYWKFKGEGDPGGAERKILDTFLGAVGGSTWLSTVTQYYDTANGNITNPTGQYVNGKKTGFLNDNKTAIGVPTDADLQAEAMKLADKFGADPNASYVIATPHDHNTSGFGTQYCAYHGAFSYKGTVIAYTDMPYMSDAGVSCGAGIINNPGTYDGVTIVEGHELAETQTDPGADYSGWGGNEGEIGDICAWQNIVNTDFGGKGKKSVIYPTQPLYSDESSSCSQTGPSGT